MKSKYFSTNSLLLFTAIIWGFAFVAQRMGMDYIGPYTFNAIRFAIGGLSLFPLIWYNNKQQNKTASQPIKINSWQKTYGGLLLGFVLFSAASLQQNGMVYTTAGKAGFITGLYVIIVAFIGIIWKQKTKITLWWGVCLATIGMYFLSVTDNFQIAIGDFIILIGAFFWAIHVQLTGYLSPRTNAIRLAQYQFFICSILSFFAALIFEKITISSIIEATYPLLYGGLLSVGIAYTIQVVVQKTAHPTYAAIILSLEAVFAALGGWIILNETLSYRALIGCCLMLAGMLAAQLDSFNPKKMFKRRQEEENE
jgi:drug/metabolite transporter (DMT)-like permease